MPEIARWRTLVCPCTSTRFYQVYELRRHATGGLSQDPVGYRCAGCHRDADTAQMQRAVQVALRKRELDALQEEVDELSVPPGTA
jgi:hypothetical protein